MNKPKVSIIMGVLNAQDRVLESIKSIQNQTFNDWEFIICDDGSTDNTYDIISDLAKDDSRIVLIKNIKNLGLAQTLNNCIEIAKGKYIARMDDDDYSYPHRLQKQVDFLDENLEYDFVSSAVDIYDGNIVTHKQCVKSVEPKKEDFLWGSCFVHPATIFRAEKIRQVNGYRVLKETKRAEDYDLFMRMYKEDMKGYNIEESLLRYYVNPSAMKKRKYIYRIDEAKVRYKGFKSLELLPKGWIYVFKPLIIGIIPKNIILKMQSHYYK